MVQQLVGVLQLSCIWHFHIPKIVPDFKLCAYNSQQGVQLMDATCNIQQCCIRLHGA